MPTTSRSLVEHRTPLLFLTCILLGLSGVNPSSAAQKAPSPPAAIILRSVETSRTPDARGTRVTLHGSHPMSYAVTAGDEDSWSLTLEGVDPRSVDRETIVGTPQLDRIVLRTIPGATGRPAVQIDFQGVSASERRVRLAGNDLVVVLEGITATVDHPASREPAAPVPPRSVNLGPGGNPVATPAVPGYLPAESRAPAQLAAQDAPRAGPGELLVGTGKSFTLNLESPVNRVSVANPSVADAVVISPQQLLINGIAPGNTSLVLWFRSGESKNFSLSVQMDVEALAGRLRQFFPQEKIEVGASKDTLILYGTVSKPEIGEKAVKIAADYSGKVVNNLSYPATGRRQILLKVVFAEVNRQAMTELSASFLRLDPLNLRGDHEGLSTPGIPAPHGNFTTNPPGPDFTFNDFINIYAFNFRDKMGVFVRALKSRGLLQVLAEPTLITADGQKASFLAGGEFPIPVVQAGAGFNSVTILFKKFGISLDFTPEIRADGTIVLKVEPEVSSLDFVNAIKLSDFFIPSLKVRRANTEVELKDGQSFAIAGLYSADLQQTKRKIPLLGDIPILGYLFRSKNLNKNKTELLVIVTPSLVEPLPNGQKPALPQFDMSFDMGKKKAEKPVQPLPAEPSGSRR